MTIEGTCHCGACGYSFPEQSRYYQFCCQFTDCVKLSSGGRLLSVAVNKADFAPSGPLTQYSYPGGSGKPIHLHFCSVCGTQLYAAPEHHPEILAVRATTLPTEFSFIPRSFNFTEEGLPWDLKSLDK